MRRCARLRLIFSKSQHSFIVILLVFSRCPSRAFSLAVSLNMITGLCGQISLGHGAFFGCGAYAAALTMVGMGSVPLALLAGVVAGSALGISVATAGRSVTER